MASKPPIQPALSVADWCLEASVDPAADMESFQSSLLDALRRSLGPRPCGIHARRAGKWVMRAQREWPLVGGAPLDVRFDPETKKPKFFFQDHRAAGDDFPFQGFAHFIIPMPTEHGDYIVSVAMSGAERDDDELQHSLSRAALVAGLAFARFLEKEGASALRRDLERERERSGRRADEVALEWEALKSDYEERLRKFQKVNQAKDEFFSVVSHELRTPLTSLVGFLSVLFEGEAGPVSEQQKKFLSIALSSARRLNTIIADLLDLSRLESGRLRLNPEACDLNDIIEQSLASFQSAAKARDIRLGFTPGELPKIFADPARLLQIVNNIVSSTIRFTGPAGKIAVRTVDQGEAVCVSIDDTGLELSMAEEKRLLEGLRDTDSMGGLAGGTGFWITIAEGLISLHGGRFWVEKTQEQGLLFSFVIPKEAARK